MTLQECSVVTFVVRNEAIGCGNKNCPYHILLLRQSLATNYRTRGCMSGTICGGLNQPTELKREISRSGA